MAKYEDEDQQKKCSLIKDTKHFGKDIDNPSAAAAGHLTSNMDHKRPGK